MELHGITAYSTSACNLAVRHAMLNGMNHPPLGGRQDVVMPWPAATLAGYLDHVPIVIRCRANFPPPFFALASGLFGSPSMFDLCIVQIPVHYPFDRPLLRPSPITGDRIGFRYVDTHEKEPQWHRTVDADQAWLSLNKFLDQLRWFPEDVLETLSNGKRS